MKFLKKLLIVVIVLLIIALFLVHYIANSALVRDKIAEIVTEKIGATCQIEDHSVSLLGSFEAKNIEILVEGAQRKILTIEKATGNKSLSELFEGNVFPNDIRVKNINVYLENLDNGKWNFPFLNTQKVELKQLVEVDVKSINVELNLKSPEGPVYKAEATIDKITTNLGGVQQNIKFKGEISPTTNLIDSLSLQTYEGTVEAKGKVELDLNMKPPVKSADIDVKTRKIQLSSVSALADLKGAEVHGKVNSDAKITYENGIPNIALQAKTGELKLRHPWADEILKKLKETNKYLLFKTTDINLNINPGMIDINKIELLNHDLLNVIARKGSLKPDLLDIKQSILKFPLHLDSPYRRIKIKDLRSADGLRCEIDFNFEGPVYKMREIVQKEIQAVALNKVINRQVDKVNKKLEKYNIKIGGEELDIGGVISDILTPKTVPDEQQPAMPNDDNAGEQQKGGEAEENPIINQKNANVLNDIIGEVLRQKAEKDAEKEDPDAPKKKDAERVLDGILNIFGN